MKVSDMYALTKQVMFEKPSSTIYDNYLFGNLNLVISELFNENNNARMFKGKKPLKEVPVVANLDDEIVYEEEYQREVMPVGLASYFLIDDDLQKYHIYSVRYNNARVINQRLVSKEVVDAFTADTEL